MTFPRVNLLGWALFEELTSAQMNQLDIDHSNAVDGLNGGTYNLSAELRFENDTVFIEMLEGTNGTFTDFEVTDDLDVGGDQTIAGTLQVTSYASFRQNNTIVADADETLFDGYQTTPIRYYTGNNTRTTTLDSSMSTYGWFKLINGQTANRTIMDGIGVLTSLRPGEWAMVAKIGASWYVIHRGMISDRFWRSIVAIGSDANQDIDPSLYNMFTVASGILTATRTFTIDPTPTYSYNGGEYFELVNFSSFGITVKDPAAVTINSVPASGGSGNPGFGAYARSPGGTWFAVQVNSP